MLAINSSTENLYAGALTALRMQLRTGQTLALPHEAYVFVPIHHVCGLSLWAESWLPSVGLGDVSGVRS